MKNIAIIIPAYRPMNALPEYIEELLTHQVEKIMVVNDGSENQYDEIFQKIRDIPQVTLLEHEVNQGKGAALKTAFSYILEEKPEITGVITVDADGQHAIADVVRIGVRLNSLTAGFVIGMREFKLRKVPLRSWIGNQLTSRVFQTLFGTYIRDTQTGLRGLKVSELEWVNQLKGDRFEFEMNMLINMVKKDKPFVRMDIETVYHEEHISNYATYKDSLRIIRILTKSYLM